MSGAEGTEQGTAGDQVEGSREAYAASVAAGKVTFFFSQNTFLVSSMGRHFPLLLPFLYLVIPSFPSLNSLCCFDGSEAHCFQRQQRGLLFVVG